MSLEKDLRDSAEGELINLVRRHDAQNFTLKIELTSCMFRVEVADLNTIAEPAKGTGRTFAEAWHDLTADSLRS